MRKMSFTTENTEDTEFKAGGPTGDVCLVLLSPSFSVLFVFAVVKRLDLRSTTGSLDRVRPSEARG